jgi:uncharacterized protein
VEPIYIPHLANRRDKTLEIVVDRTFDDLDTLTPVRGKIGVKHCGNYLDISTRAETIVTLCCYRCLQQYNHRLQIHAQEVIWLDPAAQLPDDGPLERETAIEDLVESLSPDGHFQPDTWLYEQLCLAIPQRQLCDRDCGGIKPPSESPEIVAPSTLDRRWGALSSLKQQLEKEGSSLQS